VKWTVAVYDALAVNLVAFIENGVNTDTGRVAIRRFDPPVITPPGSSRVLNIYARQDELEIPPRAILTLALNSEWVFGGPVVTCPPNTAPGAGPFDRDRDALERITAVGAAKLLEDSIVAPRLFTERIDVATVAYQLCQLSAHPALFVDDLYFPLTGAVLDGYYAPEMRLKDCLDELASLVPGGADHWVDALLGVHFEALAEGEDS